MILLYKCIENLDDSYCQWSGINANVTNIFRRDIMCIIVPGNIIRNDVF